MQNMSSGDIEYIKEESLEEISRPNMAGSTEFLEALIHHGNSKKQGSAFLEKLYEILANEEYSNFISWCADGKSILIKKVEDFSQIVLPKYYKHNNFQSFVRQLNMYNFTKTSHDANRREFKQPLFRKGKRNLLPLISRKTQKAIRSIDSTLEHVDANDLIDVTIPSGGLEGRTIMHCKSIDSSSPRSESAQLWRVIQTLQKRVTSLEMKLYEVCSEGDAEHEQDCHDSYMPTVKKIRTHSSKILSPCNRMSGADEEPDSFVNIGVSSRCRATSRRRSSSFGSFDSGITSTTSTSSGNGNRDMSSGSNSGELMPAKRGVDAILSAAEILHDDHQEKRSLSSEVDTHPPSGYPHCTETEGCDSLSDESTSSPVYFKEEKSDPPLHALSRMPGLPLSRTSTIS